MDFANVININLYQNVVDMELEEWLRTKTSLFSRYKRDNGCDLTMEMVHQVIDKFKPREKLNFDDIEKVSV